jgi:glycosyltransferase involved in cell wall biosynthesis
MRIAVCNTFGRFLGGIESYLGRVIPALAQGRHELAMLFETDSPTAHPLLPIPGRAWFVSAIGVAQTLRELYDWRPDIIYTHAMSDTGFERSVIETAPAVHFSHDYSATCISGAKAFAFPNTRWCSRRFGAQCLVNYFPRRCGGSSPSTMWRNYRRCVNRLELMRGYRRIFVASQKMRREYRQHGFEASRLELVKYPITEISARIARTDSGTGTVRSSDDRWGVRSNAVHLLFAGRMVRLKGGEILLRALPSATQTLGRPLKLTLAGDGPAKADWEAQARVMCAQNPLITVEFTGWLGQSDLLKLIAACDLLVVPSLWPEPFGMIGPEAGAVGLPAAAFAVGGIPEWLHDGINGFLAPANPPSAAGLAAAVAKCLADPLLYQRLRQGAQREAMKFSLQRHVARLLEIFTQVAAEGTDTGRREAEPTMGTTSAVE